MYQKVISHTSVPEKNPKKLALLNFVIRRGETAERILTANNGLKAWRQLLKEARTDRQALAEYQAQGELINNILENKGDSKKSDFDLLVGILEFIVCENKDQAILAQKILSDINEQEQKLRKKYKLVGNQGRDEIKSQVIRDLMQRGKAADKIIRQYYTVNQ